MDDNLRYAIWHAHDRRCLYTGEYLEDFKALEIDHIIPESTPADILAEKIRIHNLGNDFNVKTSLNNLAPSTRLANAKKGKEPFPLHRETYYLEIVSRKVERVKANLAKIEAQQFQKRKWLIENKSGNDFRFEEEFEVYRNLTVSEYPHAPNHYFMSNTELRFNAFLPSCYQEFGSCLIELRNESVMTTINHKNIMEMVSDFKKRGIAYLLPEIPSMDDKFFVTIHNTSIHLSTKAFLQLRAAFEDFLSEYDKQYRLFLDFLEIGDLEVVRDNTHCVLKRINRSEWKQLLEYASKYDLDRGKGAQFCFNQPGAQIICLNLDLNVCKFWLIPATVSDRGMESFVYLEGELEVLWKIPAKSDRRNIESGGVYTAKKTLEWLNETLLNFRKEK